MEERKGILLNDLFEQINNCNPPGSKISVSYGLLLESMILNLKSLKDGFQVTSRYWVAYKELQSLRKRTIKCQKP